MIKTFLWQYIFVLSGVVAPVVPEKPEPEKPEPQPEPQPGPEPAPGPGPKPNPGDDEEPEGIHSFFYSFIQMFFHGLEKKNMIISFKKYIRTHFYKTEYLANG